MLAPESVLNEQYRITYIVDERPDGVIYRAIDTRQSLRVLIAALPQPHEGAIGDVQHLAEQLVGVTAPGLLSLRDHFAQGLTYYLVADDPGGQDLERVSRDRGGPLPEHEVLNSIERLLNALDVLHSRTPPLLIGDLRSTDLWSSLDGGLFLAPFAMARHMAGDASPYRAPELQESSAEPTTSSDIYAIGAVLYQLLTGWAPPTASQRQAGTPLNSPRVLNARVSTLAEQLVLRSLELRSVNRYQQAREMRSALETVRLMAGRPLGATAPLDPARAAAQPGSIPPPPSPVPPLGGQPTPEPGSVYGPPPPAPPPAAAPPQWGPSTQYGAPQPAGAPQWSGQPGYTTVAPAAPPRQSGRFSNGCLLAIVAALAVIALAICLVGAWVGWFVINQGGSLPFLGGQAAMATAGPAAGGGSTLPADSQPDPATQAIIAAGAPYTQTAQLSDEVVGAVLYAPDGARIAVGLGGAIELRDGATLEPGSRLEGHDGEISALAFTPDGAALASGAQNDPVIRVWDAAAARELRTLEGHTGWIRSLAYSPDGAILASGSTDQTIILWDAATGQQLRTLQGHTDFLGNIAFSPDGATLLSVSRDGTARLWDVASGAQRDGFAYTAPTDPQSGAPYWLTGASFSPDGRSIAIGSVSGSIYVLDTANGRLNRELQGHEGWVVIRGVSFSPDGNLIASASLDGSVRLWSPRTGAERGVLEQAGLRLLGLTWNPDGNTLAVSSDTSGLLSIWDVDRRELAQSVVLAQGAVTALSYAQSGAALATGGVNGSVKIHVLADGREIPLSGGAPTSQYLAFLSDTQLVAVSDGGAVVVLTVAGPTREESRQLEGLDGLALTVDVSRDGRLIAAGNEQGEITIWDARSFEVQRSLRGLGGPVYALAFNRDGSQIAAATNQPAEQPKVIVWDVASGDRRTTFSGHAGPITSLEMPAGADLVASASSDGSLKLWQAASGDEVRALAAPAEQGWYSSMTFSPDGTLMVTGSLAGQVEFWNAASGERLSGIDLGENGTILGLTFRPDGGQLAVATRDGGVILLEAQL